MASDNENKMYNADILFLEICEDKMNALKGFAIANTKVLDYDFGCGHLNNIAQALV